MQQAVTGLHPGLHSADISYSMHLEVLFRKEHVCRIPKEFWIGPALTQLAVKTLFDDSTGFDEMRWAIVLPQKQT